MKIDNTHAHCYIYTVREGALSPIGHDLKLEATRFDAEVSTGKLSASFDTGAVRVVGVMKDGLLDKSELADKDRKKIESNIAKEVLKSRKFKDVVFESDDIDRADDTVTLNGKLTLNGQTRPLTVVMKHVQDDWVGEVELTQSNWGVEPFRAFLGQLRIKDEVNVEFRVAASHFETLDL